MALQFLNAAIAGAARKETLNGREYLVAPVTLIVPGVLNGSEGELYYPPDQVATNLEAWNNMPLVVYHPKDDEGKPISARDPKVLNHSGIGYIFANRYDDAHRADAWFDVAATAAYDKRHFPNEPAKQILPRVRNGKPIEISTGLFLDARQAPDGYKNHKGEVYNGRIASNYRPDHLAVLPDEAGACSIGDGCGINVNQQGDPMTTKAKFDRNKALAELTANCTCDKTKAAYAAMPDEALEQVANARSITLIVNAIKSGKKLTINADGEGEAVPGVPWTKLAVLLGIDIDPRADPVGFAAALKSALDEISGKLGGAPSTPVTSEEEEEPVTMADPDPEAAEAAELAANTRLAKRLGFASVAAMSATLNTAKRLETEARTAMIERLQEIAAGDSLGPKQKALIANKLKARPSIEQLEELLTAFDGEQEPTNNHLPTFPFAASVVGNSAADDDTDLPTLPVMDWQSAASRAVVNRFNRQAV